MKILITGSTGLLGQALSRRLAPTGDVTGVSRHPAQAAEVPRHVVCDLTDGAQASRVVRSLRPDVVIHTQAMSDVDRCEHEPRLTDAMNIAATSHVVGAAAQTGSCVVFVSTDYVFDGTKGAPYDEGDTPNPISVYGASKLEGERLTLRYDGGMVVRPSTLFGPGRTNFCDQIVARLAAGEEILAFEDQSTSPTYTEDLAEGIADVIQALRRSPDLTSLPSRVVHMSNAGGCSRLEFACRVADLLGRSREPIRAIRMAEQRRPAPRPAYSVLTTRYLSDMIGRSMRPWDVALHEYLRARRWLR